MDSEDRQKENGGERKREDDRKVRDVTYSNPLSTVRYVFRDLIALHRLTEEWASNREK